MVAVVVMMTVVVMVTVVVTVTVVVIVCVLLPMHSLHFERFEHFCSASEGSWHETRYIRMISHWMRSPLPPLSLIPVGVVACPD